MNRLMSRINSRVHGSLITPYLVIGGSQMVSSGDGPATFSL
jgi:hypothetical protein